MKGFLEFSNLENFFVMMIDLGNLIYEWIIKSVKAIISKLNQVIHFGVEDFFQR
jgi:hypothetical protein